jgi:ABC-2 type transport system permease protein
MTTSLRTQIGHLALRSVVRTARQPAVVGPALVFPLFLLAVDAGGLHATTHLPGFPGDSYLGFALAITLMQGALFATTATGIGLAEDVRTGFLHRLSLTPIRGIAILAAQLAGAAVLAIVQSALYLGVGLLSGVTIRTGVPGALALIALTVLVATGFAALGAFWALRTGSGEKVQALFPLVFAAFFLSSLFLPRALITTAWFRAVASANPVSYMIEGMRSLIVSGWDARALLLALACAGALLAVSLAAAATCLRARFSGALASGRSRHGSRGLSTAVAVARHTLHVTLRSPGLLLPPVLFPVFVFAAFAGGLAGIGRAPHFGYPDFTGFVFVFVLIQSAALGGVFAGVALAGEVETGLVRRIVLAAPRPWPILVGHLLAALARALLTSAVLTGLALAAGMHVPGGAGGLAELLALALLVTVAGTMFAAAVALRLRTTQAAPLMQIPVLLAMFLAPAYTPRPLMSGWARAAADVNPATLLLETGRAVLAGQAGRVGPCVAVLAAAIAVLAAGALHALGRAEVAAG